MIAGYQFSGDLRPNQRCPTYPYLIIYIMMLKIIYIFVGLFKFVGLCPFQYVISITYRQPEVGLISLDLRKFILNNKSQAVAPTVRTLGKGQWLVCRTWQIMAMCPVRSKVMSFVLQLMIIFWYIKMVEFSSEQEGQRLASNERTESIVTNI